LSVRISIYLLEDITIYKKTITNTMPAINKIAHGNPPWGRGVLLAFARAGLNLAIFWMVAPDSASMPKSKEVNRIKSARAVVILLSALAACQKPAPLPPGLFPESAAGGWRRTALHDMPVSDSPDPVPRTSVDRLAVASYEGPGKLEARVYALTSPAVGVDLAQRWRPSADTVFFYRGRYFVVVKWQSAERKSLEAFVRQLEEALGPEKTPAS
jgi:hypothetical protein